MDQTPLLSNSPPSVELSADVAEWLYESARAYVHRLPGVVRAVREAVIDNVFSVTVDRGTPLPPLPPDALWALTARYVRALVARHGRGP